MKNPEGLIKFLIPIVLRCSITIYNVKANGFTFVENYQSIAKDLGLYINDNLNFHDSLRLHLLYTVADDHYDLLYSANSYS